MAKYTVITPNFNGFSLMENYFKSLLAQTFKDFEVIIVDDCSTDGSFEQLQEYASNSTLDIKVYRSEMNAGPGNARNIGIEHASGEYITFVDNDDWLDETWLEEINKVYTQNPEINCVIYDYYIKSDESQSVGRSMYKGEQGVCSLSECMMYVRNHSIGKFYKLACCRDIKFPIMRRCEDVAYVCRAVEACGTVYYLKKPFYYYYQRSSSLSNNKKLDESDMVKAFSVLEDSLGDKYPAEMKEKSVTDLLYGGLLMMAKSGKSGKQIKQYIKNYEEKYPEWWKCEILNEIGKAKKIFLICARYKLVVLIKLIAYIHSKMV